MPTSSGQPVVSVIMPVRNEADHVRRAVCSLLNKPSDEFELEVLVVDGASADSTAAIVHELEEQDPRVHYLLNLRRNTPSAFNIGLRTAQGEYVCIFGAHTEYDSDYIEVCFSELQRTGVAGCSGRVRTAPANNSWHALLVANAFSHSFGSSSNSVRTQRPGFVDTIPYPLFRKQVLLDVGGYDEALFRNQDNDMNQRLRARGHKLYLTDKTSARLFARPTLWSLMKYAYKSGSWNFITLRRNRSAMSLRHFVPFIFVMAILGGVILAMVSLAAPEHRRLLCFPLAAVFSAHLGVGYLFALRQWIRTHQALSLLLPSAWFLLHAAYGSGTLGALVSNCMPPSLHEGHHCATP